jgi:hypothetical protein
MPSSQNTYQRLLKRAAKLLRIKPASAAENEAAQHLCVLLAARESLAAQVFNGKSFSTSELLQIDAAIRAHIPPPKHDIRIRFVGPSDEAKGDAPSVSGVVKCRRCGWVPPGNDKVGKCYRCGWHDGFDTNKPWQPIDLSPPAADEKAGAGDPKCDAPPAPTSKALPAPAPKPAPTEPTEILKTRSVHETPDGKYHSTVKGAGAMNQYLGGFSAGRDSFNQPRWPNPQRNGEGY